MENKKKVELMEIALKHIEEGYDNEEILYDNDLYYVTPEEKDLCSDFYEECMRIGTVAFQEKITALDKTK